MSTRKDEIFFPVPQECMGRVIGKGGKRINQIKHETRTRIKAVNTASGKECGFLITGTATGREEAKQAIKSYLTEIFVPVPKQYMGRVIGKGGNKINQLKQKTQTLINTGTVGKESGFVIIGTAAGCEEAKQEITRNITQCAMSIKEIEIFVPVPKEYMGRLIGKGGNRINELKQRTQTLITTINADAIGQESGFVITGTATNCEEAKQEIREDITRCVENIPEKRNIEVAEQYITQIVGKGRKNLMRIETDSDTKIKILSNQNADAEAGGKVKLEIVGRRPKNCVRAEVLIRCQIVAQKGKELREKLGGDHHFVSFAFKSEKDRFCLKPGGSAPKLNGFIQGIRYRIETEVDEDDEYDDEPDSQIGFSEKTISELETHLLKPLESLNEIKDEKKLMADLWCHFGKVLVFNVDEEDPRNVLTASDIDERVRKRIDQTTNNETNSNWKFSFEEGVLKSDVIEDALPNDEDKAESHEFFYIKLIRTRWRYDFTFVSPSERNVRLKAWEGLPSDSHHEPPDEVKNILRPVFLHGDDSIKAWICYPSTSVVRDEILTPDSKYDCRMKLRVGPRYVSDKDSVCEEEDECLAHYLSNCKFDKENHHIDLPEQHDMEDHGFKCIFYREEKEKIFEASFNEECFTFIVSDQKKWDSDSLDKREEEKFGIRVVLNSWSEKLLSPEQCWTPEEILEKAKLETYMTFVSMLKDHLFECQ